MKVELLLIGIVLTVSLKLHAQEKQDTTKVEVYEEPAKTSNYKRRERFKYFRWNMLEEKSMTKITAFPYKNYYRGGAAIGIGYEHKITPSFSLGAEARTYIPIVNYHDAKSHQVFTTLHAGFVRYYYLQKMHLRKQMSGNNLLSNYIELRAENVFNYQFKEVYLEWGMQRRVGKYGYFDFGIGMGTATKLGESISLAAHVAFGLGFSGKNVHLKKNK